ERLKMEPSLASAHREVGSWVYCTKGVVDTLCPLEVHIRFIIHQVRRRRKIFASIQRKYRTDLLCYFASESDIGGFDLSPGLMTELGRLRLGLRTDEYFCCGSKRRVAKGKGGNVLVQRETPVGRKG